LLVAVAALLAFTANAQVYLGGQVGLGANATDLTVMPDSARHARPVRASVSRYPVKPGAVMPDSARHARPVRASVPRYPVKRGMTGVTRRNGGFPAAVRLPLAPSGASLVNSLEMKRLCTSELTV